MATITPQVPVAHAEHGERGHRALDVAVHQRVIVYLLAAGTLDRQQVAAGQRAFTEQAVHGFEQAARAL